MDALAGRLHCFCRVHSSSSSGRCSIDFVRSSVSGRGFCRLGARSVRVSSLNGSASSSSQEGDGDPAEEPPENDAEAEHENMRHERLINGENSGKSEHSSTPSCIPSKEVLLRLRRNAELRRRYDDLAKNYSCQPNADLQLHSSEVRVPSWAATALTFVIAFSAGVALAQFRGGLTSRNKPGFAA